MPGAVFDRLVEVWAADDRDDGYCGSGWVLGERAVLTAAHVLHRLHRGGWPVAARRVFG